MVNTELKKEEINKTVGLIFFLIGIIMERKEKIINVAKEIIPYIIIIIVILLVKKYLFTTVLVNGNSMNTSLYENDVMI